MSECDDAEVLVRKFLAKIRQVELTSLGIFEVRAGNMDLPFFQPAQSQLA